MIKHPFSPEEFRAIYSKVPRVCIDLVFRTSSSGGPQRVLLTRRTIDPKVWHLPGGTVQHGESLFEAANRVAKRELGCTLYQIFDPIIGVIEYPSHRVHNDCPIGLLYAAPWDSADEDNDPIAVVLNDEADEFMWATEPPDNTHPDQVATIRRLIRGDL